MRIIECTVNNEYIVGGGVPIGAAGSHDDVVLRLAFGEMWTGLNIYATFTDALGENATAVMLLPSMLVSGTIMTYDLPIPASAKRIEGRTSLSLTGYTVVNGTEGIATNTATAYFRVLPSKVALLDDGTVDATLAEQLLSEMNYTEERVGEAEEVAATAAREAANAVDTSNAAVDVANAAKEISDEVKARADRGEFKGDKGDQGERGQPGNDGRTPVKGTDYYTESDKSEMVDRVVAALPKYRGEAVDV